MTTPRVPSNTSPAPPMHRTYSNAEVLRRQAAFNLLVSSMLWRNVLTGPPIPIKGVVLPPSPPPPTSKKRVTFHRHKPIPTKKVGEGRPPTREVRHISPREIKRHEEWILKREMACRMIAVALVVIWVGVCSLPLIVDGYKWTLWLVIPTALVLMGVHNYLSDGIEEKKKAFFAERIYRYMEPVESARGIKFFGYGDLDALDDRFSTDRLFHDELSAAHPESLRSFGHMIDTYDLQLSDLSKVNFAKAYAGMKWPLVEKRGHLVASVVSAKNDLLLQKKFTEYENKMCDIREEFGCKNGERKIADDPNIGYFASFAKEHYPEFEKLFNKGRELYAPLLVEQERLNEAIEQLQKDQAAGNDRIELMMRSQRLQRQSEVLGKQIKRDLLVEASKFVKEWHGGFPAECRGKHESAYLEYLMEKEKALIKPLQNWVEGHFLSKMKKIRRVLDESKEALRNGSEEQQESYRVIKREYLQLLKSYRKNVTEKVDCHEAYAAHMAKYEEFSTKVLAFHRIATNKPSVMRAMWNSMTYSTPLEPFQEPPKALHGRAQILRVHEEMRDEDRYLMRLVFFQKLFLQWVAVIVMIVFQLTVTSATANFGVQMGALGIILTSIFISSCIRSSQERLRSLKMEEKLLKSPVIASKIRHLPEKRAADRLGIDLTPRFIVSRIQRNDR